MAATSDSSLLGKKFLYVLPVLVVLIAWNLFFNPDARELLGLKKGKAISFDFFKRKGGVAAVSAVKAPKFSAEEFGVFEQSLTQRELPQGLVIVTNVAEATPPRETEEERLARLDKERVAKETDAKKKLAYLWPVRVQGAYQDLQGRWTAIVAGHNVYVHDKLASGREDKCVYSVLAVGQQCGWMRVVPPGLNSAELAKLPESVVWPDVALIELDKTGIFRREYVPARVRLGNGTTLGKNDALKYKATGTTFKVKELWMNGVVFEVSNSDASAEVACVLVTP